MSIDRNRAVQRALDLADESPLDAATIAVAEQLTRKDNLTLEEAVDALKNNQIAELAGFLTETKTCKELEIPCDTSGVDHRQMVEWEVDPQDYCVAHEIALLAHMTERRRENLD
ncbi:hypothetical protein [Acidithiobacillus sp.]